MYNLQGKVCVVAGASSGIGREICLTLSRFGAIVICAARRKENLEETIQLMQEENGKGEAYACDFLNPSEVEKLASYVKERHGKIDLWVNGVGVNTAMGITWDLPFDEWFRDVSGNLHTCYIGTKCAINQMKTQEEGIIINMSGGGVIRAETYNSAYACAKTAVVRFTECVDLELKKENLPISIFSFGPGLVRTERTIELVNKEETKKFMPGIIDAIKNDEATPIQVPAEWIAFIATGAVNDLSGALLISSMDKEVLENNNQEMIADGLYRIHVKGLE